jgi:hypothetical protein
MKYQGSPEFDWSVSVSSVQSVVKAVWLIWLRLCRARRCVVKKLGAPITVSTPDDNSP